MDSLINQLKNQELTIEMVLQQGLARAIVNYPAASSDSPGNMLDQLLEIRSEPELVSAINTAFQDDLVRRLLLDCLEDATFIRSIAAAATGPKLVKSCSNVNVPWSISIPDRCQPTLLPWSGAGQQPRKIGQAGLALSPRT